jgi:predicted transcriptional regulator
MKSRLRDFMAAHEAYQVAKENIRRDGGPMLREWRKGKGVSLRAIARRLCVSPSYLSKVERGIEFITPELTLRILEEMEK